MFKETVTAIIATPIQLINAYELFSQKYSEFNFQTQIDNDSSTSSQKQIRSVADELNIKIIEPVKSPAVLSKFRLLQSAIIIYHYYMLVQKSRVLIVGNYTNKRANFLITIMPQTDCWYVDDGLNTLMYPYIPTRKDLSDEVAFHRSLLGNLKRLLATLIRPTRNIRFFSIYNRADQIFVENSYQCISQSAKIELFHHENRVIFLGGPYVSTKVIGGMDYHGLLSDFVAWARLEFPQCSIEYHAHRRETVEVKYAFELFDVVVTDAEDPIELRLLKKKVKVQAIFSNESSAVFTCQKIGLSNYGGFISIEGNSLYIRSTPYMKLFWKNLEQMIDTADGISKINLSKR